MAPADRRGSGRRSLYSASAFTRGLVEGERVRLEFEEGGSTKDRYGRTLGYIYLEDGRLLNLEIIEKGYGHAYTRFPFSRMEEFRAAERYARETGRGLWADESVEAGIPWAPSPHSPALEDSGAAPQPSSSLRIWISPTNPTANAAVRR